MGGFETLGKFRHLAGTLAELRETLKEDFSSTRVGGCP
jgi:hypothetical protein